MNPNYWHWFIGMWPTWLIWMIPICGLKLVSSMQPCSKESCLWQWKIWPSYNTNIHYDMPPSREVDIHFKFEGLNLETMFLYSRQRLPHCMWQPICHSTCEKSFIFGNFVVERLGSSNMCGKTMCKIMHHVTFHMWMTKWRMVKWIHH
jgi:hypothetical protein